MSGSAARAVLTHRYTFNSSGATDLVGNADGTLNGNAFIDVNGLLQLPGGSSDFLSLDAPAINIASYTDITFEGWFTVNQFATWARLFDFGDRTLPASQQGYIYYTPQGNTGAPLARYSTGGSGFTQLDHGPLQTGDLYHLALVIDDDANGGSDLMSLYLDGVLQDSIAHSRSLSDVPTTFAYLGESLIAGDPNFNGSIDEFRIYDNALTQTEIANHEAEGPTPISRLRLEVNTVTGSVAILGTFTTTIPLDYYKITSISGALDPSGWSSLDDQDLDEIGPGSGESWNEGPSSETELVELFLLGATTISPEERVELGHAYDVDVYGQGVSGDVSFFVGSQGSQVLQSGAVIYVTPDPLDGDYNGDLTVNAADYTVWRNAVGGTYNAAADGDGDGVNDRDDYAIWKWTYGNSAGAASVASDSAPEPATTFLLLTAVVCGAHFPRRFRRLRQFNRSRDCGS